MIKQHGHMCSGQNQRSIIHLGFCYQAVEKLAKFHKMLFHSNEVGDLKRNSCDLMTFCLLEYAVLTLFRLRLIDLKIKHSQEFSIIIRSRDSRPTLTDVRYQSQLHAFGQLASNIIIMCENRDNDGTSIKGFESICILNIK